MSEEKYQYTEDDIKSWSPSEWWAHRIARDAKINLIYVIIGYLLEFWGGHEPSPLGVEGFGKDEYSKALVFKNLCSLYLLSINESDDVELTDFVVKSEKIAAILKTYYPKRIAETRMFTLSPDDDLFKFPWEWKGYSSEIYNYLQYSFLIGVFYRRRIKGDNRIIFAGTKSKKAGWAIDFLRNFQGFGDDEMTVRYLFNHVPDSASIYLSENNLLWSLIDKFVEDNDLLQE